MIETNLYRLGGLQTVTARYRLFEIRGNDVPEAQYYAGVTRLQGHSRVIFSGPLPL